MRTLLRSVREFLGEALAGGGKVGVAVSGGADSVALLELVSSVAAETAIEPVVLHFDHGLRPESDEDRRFVEGLAAERGLAFRAERAASAPSARGSVEDWARRARYDFFRRAAEALGLRAVATGHTADDQAETILFRLLVRGAGSRGLAGIPAVRDAGGFLILRPLLDHRRAAIIRLLEHRGIAWRDDQSNRSLLFARNKIRHQVIPFLIEQCNPRLVESLCRTAEILRMENERLEDEAEAELAEWGEREGVYWRPLDVLVRIPEAIRFRAVGRLMERLGIYPSFDLVESLDRLAGEGGRIDLSPELAAWVEDDLLRIGAFRPTLAIAGEFEILVPGSTRIPVLGVTIETMRLDAAPRLAELHSGVVGARRLADGFQAAAHLAAATIVGRLVLRTRRPGDRMTPFGMDGSKKLQDIFTDEKISRAERDRWPLLCDDRGVLWIVGLRQDERTRVREETKDVLRIRVEAARVESEEPEESA
jgi:tRNA(Ile)-lysidine synthase